jgi:hypothetical protein
MMMKMSGGPCFFYGIVNVYENSIQIIIFI